MELSMKHMADNSNFCLEAPDLGASNAFKLNMIEENVIQSILPVTKKVFNGKVEYCYDISSKRSLTKMAELGSVTHKQITDILLFLRQTADELDEYLLSPNELLLSPDCIYLSFSEDRYFFCYVPGLDKTFVQSLRELFQYILEKIDHKDGLSVMLAYELYRVSLNENATINDFLSVLDTVSGEALENLHQKPSQFYKDRAIQSHKQNTQYDEQSIKINSSMDRTQHNGTEESQEPDTKMKLQRRVDKSESRTSGWPVAAAIAVFVIVIWILLR